MVTLPGVMLVGKNILPWTRRLKSNERQWPNPQDSTGVLYRKMGRDLSCWEAVGKARETFIRIADEIKAYLEKYSDPVHYPVTWTIYMIGRTRETSEPVIMFCCRDSNSRKQVRETIEGSGVLDKYQKIKVGDASRPPDFDQLVQLAGVSFDSMILSLSDPNVDSEYVRGLKESMCTNTLAFAEQSEGIFGKRIVIPFHDEKSGERVLTSLRQATAGGVLRSGERYFYLTAGHAFETIVGSSLPHLVEGMKMVSKISFPSY